MRRKGKCLGLMGQNGIAANGAEEGAGKITSAGSRRVVSFVLENFVS